MSNLPDQLRKAAAKLDAYKDNAELQDIVVSLQDVLIREANIQTTLDLLEEIGFTDGALTLSAYGQMWALARAINESSL